MRVISGSAKGRILKAVPGRGTRPTTDKVKEAIFSMIGPYFEGGTVLDLFAGTGALAIESLSRGADKAVLVDLEAKSIAVIKQNLRQIGFEDRAEVYRSDAARALKALNKRQLAFDLVFLDPPYRNTGMEEMIRLLDQYELLHPGAWIVVEHDAEHTYPETVERTSRNRRTVYGETALSIYRMGGVDR